MITVKTFTFNAYSENTYLLFDETKACVIIDPGMYEGFEENQLAFFIRQESLNPVLLLNTHCHIDHVFGNSFVFDTYGLKPQFHAGELPILNAVPGYAPAMGFTRYQRSPLPNTFLPETGEVKFGNSVLSIIFSPGHSPAHLCFYSETDHLLIGGDVLFQGSIGRTDLPGGNHQQLIQNISDKIFVLPDETVVYPGHGPTTTIGFEKQHNPFF
ncbi:MBL fold metallo-hydrolase [Pedobacter sandarakinus]|uniref:MBL fold metallo-hydrolase n=1 Tax=Pedobacter sandarakinus TaxID=353156 RepID=UPI0022471AD0|nr:MBL fold metallo-hydrolase [Pedobacter sandarakinus]MCX2573503.1 MBL fold metallo-hydrolase [Pedobacter sandarakinus]